MAHILNNPIWNALISGNSNLAIGTESIKYFPSTIAPFIGLKEVTEESLKQLHEILPAERIGVLITADQPVIPQGWNIITQDVIYQMTGENLSYRETQKEIVPLGEQHVPQMLALTKLTNPGPFSERTIEFGHYKGIFEDGKLAAMAGRRMHAGEHVEVSAVCTHPDHLGKGYAGMIVLEVARGIIEQGYTPYLHVRQDNKNAISLYEKLGFKIRCDMNVNVLQKAAV